MDDGGSLRTLLAPGRERVGFQVTAVASAHNATELIQAPQVAFDAAVIDIEEKPFLVLDRPRTL